MLSPSSVVFFCFKERLDNIPGRSLDQNEMQRLSDELQEVRELAMEALKNGEKVKTFVNDTNKSYENLMMKLSKAQTQKPEVNAKVQGIPKPQTSTQLLSTW